MAGYKEYFRAGFKLRYFPDEKTIVFLGGKDTNKQELLRVKNKLETLLQIDSAKKQGNEISLKISPNSTTNVDELIRSLGLKGGLEREDAASLATDEAEQGAEQAEQQNAPQPNVAPPPGQNPPPPPGVPPQEPGALPESIMPFFFESMVDREKGPRLGDIQTTKQPFINGMPRNDEVGNLDNYDPYMSEDEIDKELGLKEFFFKVNESFSLGPTQRDPLNMPSYNAHRAGWGHGKASKDFGNYLGDKHTEGDTDETRVDTYERNAFKPEDELEMPLEEAFKFSPDPVKQKKAKLRKRPGKYWKPLESVTGKNRYKLREEDLLQLRRDYTKKPFSEDRNIVLVSLDKAADYFYDFLKRKKSDQEAERFFTDYMSIGDLDPKDYSENIDDSDFDATTGDGEENDAMSALNLPNDFGSIDYSDIEIEK